MRIVRISLILLFCKYLEDPSNKNCRKWPLTHTHFYTHLQRFDLKEHTCLKSHLELYFIEYILAFKQKRSILPKSKQS